MRNTFIVLDGEWRRTPSFGRVGVDAFKVGIAFFAAYSLALVLATLHLARISNDTVESVIAASIVAGAINNVWPMLVSRRWPTRVACSATSV